MRFPGFEGEWERKKLGDVAKRINTKNHENKINLVFSNSATQGIIFQVDYFDKNIANKSNLDGYYIVKPLNFVYNPRISAHAEVGAMSLNKTGEIGLVSPLYTVFKITDTSVDVLYIEALFSSKVWHSYIRSIANYGARDDRMSIKNEDFLTLSLKIPSIREQQKIANFLNLIDERIQTQMKIIEELEKSLKGYCQLLIKSKVPNKKLRDCVYCYSSTLKGTDVLEKNEKYPVYGASGIIAYISTYQANENAILIVKDGSGVGNVQYSENEFSIIGTLNYLKSKQGVNLKYVFYCLKYFDFQKYKVGSGIPHIYFKDYGEALIFCPSLQEQKGIEKMLSAMDRKLNIEKSLLISYQQQKKYLLQNLFI